jgi:aconitate hydratase
MSPLKYSLSPQEKGRGVGMNCHRRKIAPHPPLRGTFSHRGEKEIRHFPRTGVQSPSLMGYENCSVTSKQTIGERKMGPRGRRQLRGVSDEKPSAPPTCRNDKLAMASSALHFRHTHGENRMSAKTFNSFGVKERLSSSYHFFSLPSLGKRMGLPMEKLPFSIRVLLENLVRMEDGQLVTKTDVETLAHWSPSNMPEKEIPFIASRVLLQDFTGVPVVVDLAAMRDAAQSFGVDPERINPLFPVDLVIDHSVQVDLFGSADAFQKNAEIEYSRNRERYSFLKWGQKALRNFRTVPPDTGIVHQVNLEYLAPVVAIDRNGTDPVAHFDTVIGTDSHTTMINGLGVLGWGVGGIEAEAAMLGQPMSMLIPEVIGVKILGRLPAGSTATDAVLTVTQLLRKRNVVGKFVEFFGPGLSELSLPDRATIANMAPEYGATAGFFPVDNETLAYLRLTGRPEEQINLVETYCKAQGLFRTDQSPEPSYSDVLELDLTAVVPSLAGPKRPQDRVSIKDAKAAFIDALTAPMKDRGFELQAGTLSSTRSVVMGDERVELTHGSVVLAAITSCTNTSNPSVMIGAGLLAKKAVEKGLRVAAHIKTSLAPGSRVVTDYLDAAGLTTYLEKLNFHLVGYGCTTCIGNSGPLPEAVSKAIKEGNLVAAAVLSGNRNFEGRINPHVKANYLASPPLVVAYALAGRMDLDLTTEPIGVGRDGPVFLSDIWPTQEEVGEGVRKAVRSDMFKTRYAAAAQGDENWNALVSPEGGQYKWDALSTYIKKPPYFEGMGLEPGVLADILDARVLAALGDSVTTDHISPAGSIAEHSPAGRYLVSQGVAKEDFNSYGARRGNHEVMIRGTFANIRLKNLLVPGVEGGVTTHLPSGDRESIFDAALRYEKEGVPLIVLAGKEYGSGSSRDWAAKGTRLLGVRAVIAESYERIHRSNLVGMGVLPLQFTSGDTRESLGLTGREVFNIEGISTLTPRAELTVRARREDGTLVTFKTLARVDAPVEVEYLAHGGILPAVLRQIIKQK